MLSLFSTVSSEAGFRLQYMEILNWGTFDENVFRIDPEGNIQVLVDPNGNEILLQNPDDLWMLLQVINGNEKKKK